MTFSTDRIMSLSALLVGIGSLFVVVYQTELTRQAQHASVRPYLYISLMSNDEGAYVMLSNTGIGPALIDEVRIHYKGRAINADPYDFYLGLKRDAVKYLNVDKVLPGRLIPAGASIQMLGAPAPEREPMLVELLRHFEIAEVPRAWYQNSGATASEKAVIEVVFSSVYGDRWRIRSDRIVPESL